MSDVFADLLSFHADWTPQGLSLEWEVAPSDAFARFRVWRRRSDPPGVLLTPDPLGGGPSFRFVDTVGPVPGDTYWIEQVGANARNIAWSGPHGWPSASTGYELWIRPDPGKGRRTFWVVLSSPGRVQVDLFDVVGRRRARLLERDCPAGWTAVPWDGMDSGGEDLPAGVYFVRLGVDGAEKVHRRITLLP